MIKPCPLCQCEAVGMEHEKHTHFFATFMPDYPGSYTIECPKCNLGLIADTEELAVAAWNSRVISHEQYQLKAINAELLEALQELCRLDEDTGLLIEGHAASELVVALDKARAAIKKATD